MLVSDLAQDVPEVGLEVKVEAPVKVQVLILGRTQVILEVFVHQCLI